MLDTGDLRRRAILRAATIALVVGTVIVPINHGDQLLRGHGMDLGFVVKVAFSYATPFVVSLVSTALSARDT